MNRNKTKMNKNLLIVLAFLLFNIGYSQQLKIWTGAASTAWDNDDNWNGGEKPTATDDVLITSAINQPVITNAGASCAHLELKNSTPGTTVTLTVKGSGSFSPAAIVMNSSGGNTSNCSLNINTGKVSVSGNITMNGNALQNDVTFSGDGNLLIGGVMTGGVLNADEKGTVTYNGVGTRNVGTYTYNNLTISGSGVRTITSGVIVNGKLNMAGTAIASAAPTYGADASLQYSAVSYTVGPEWVSPFTAKGGVLISTPGLTIASTITMGNSVADKKFNDGVTLIVEQDASLILGNTNLYLGGDFINNNGSLTTDGFVYLTGNVSQSIASFASSKGVAMNKNAGTATFTGNINTKKLIINGLGTLSLGSGLTHSFTDWERTEGALNAKSSYLKISGNIIGSGGTFTPGTGTVEFNGGAQNLGPASLTYNNLLLSGSNIKTFGAVTTINDTFSIVDGVKADLTPNLVHTAKFIKLGTSAGSGGSWGSSISNAVNKNNTFFVSNNGIVNVGPTIVISTNSLTALTTTYGTPSSSKSFDISGLAMLEGILITAPSGFEVSTDGTTFSDALTIGAAGAIASKTIYVRLKGTIDAKDYSGNIVLTSNGTTTVNVAIATSTVNKAPLTISGKSDARSYGSDNPTLIAAYSGFVNGDTALSLTTQATIATTAVKASSVGDYPITVSGAASSNYNITYETNGKLTVTPVALTITAIDNSKVYGSDNPVLTASYVGFVNEDTAASLATQPTITSTAVKNSPIGDYPITASGATSLNYNITYIPAILKVIASSNAGMIDLTISEGKLSPAFSEGVKDYTATVKNDVKDISVTPFTSDSNATIIVNGKEVPRGTASENISLKVGENTITTVITAQDGKTKEVYTIIVTREPSGNADLSDIIISAGTLDPAFDKDKNDYKVEVPNKMDSFVINPIPADPNAKVVVIVDGKSIDPTTPIDLKVGDNDIKIVVTAEDGTIKEYDVNVTRDYSNNSGLTDLAISEGILSPAFAEGTKDYTTTVPHDTTSIKVTPVTADDTAIVRVNGKEVPSGAASGEIPLEVGKNEITTVVTAQDGTITTYTIIVTREDVVPSNNAGLTDITVSDGTLSPAFTTDTKDYRVEVPYETDSIIITPKTIDPDATIEMTVDGKTITDPTAPIDLNVGENVITIVVTAPDGTQDSYVVIVDRADSTPQAIVPSNIITPNGDGKNDTWVVPGIDKYPNNSVKVFDRAARLVYSKDNYNNDWDGTYKGSPVNEDTYYYLIDLGNGSPKLKGFISILRN